MQILTRWSIGLLVLGLLAGCGNDRGFVQSKDVPATERAHPEIHEATLKDGTRCVVTPQGGISCDWGVKGGYLLPTPATPETPAPGASQN